MPAWNKLKKSQCKTIFELKLYLYVCKITTFIGTRVPLCVCVWGGGGSIAIR
jgi:hypothetical protein